MKMMRVSGLAHPTIAKAADGGCDSKRIAKALSAATGGEVSVAAILGLEMPAPPPADPQDAADPAAEA